VVRPFFGRISDKKGRSAPILLGSLISAMLLFVVPFITEFSLLLLVAVGYGFGFAMVVSSTSPLMSELAPQGLVGSSMGFLSTLMDVGQTIGPILSGVVLASALQYTGLFASLSIVLLISSVAFFFAKTEIKRDSAIGSPK